MGKILSGTVRNLGLIYKITAMLITSCVIVLMFPHEGRGEKYDYKVGAVWRGSDLVAPFDYAVLKSAEEAEAEEVKERSEAILYYVKNEEKETKAEKTKSLKWTLEEPEGDEYGTMDADRKVVILEGNVGREYRMGDFDWLDEGALAEGEEPDYVLDGNRTSLELQSRLSQLSYTSELVMAGEHIVSKGEMVTEERGRRIAALEAEEERRFSEGFSLWGRMGGQLLLAIIAFTALYMFLKNTRHRILEDNRKVLMVLVLVLLVSAMEALMVWEAPEWVLLVPMCVVPILVRVFFDMRVALYIHLTTVIILASLVPNSYEFIFYQLVTGMMSIIAVRNLEKRSQFFVLAGVIFVSYSLIYTAGVLSQDTNLEDLRME